MAGICRVDGCDAKVSAKELCKRHYRQNWSGRKFTFRPVRQKGVQVPWLLEHVNYEGDDCLKWPFSLVPGRPCVTWDGKTRIASRVMCELRNGPPPSTKHDAAHSCGKGHEGCVNPNHLRWATRKENFADMVRHGTRVQGEGHWNSVLTEQKVRDIREMAEVLPIGLIANEFGVSRATVHHAVNRKTWRHVT